MNDMALSAGGGLQPAASGSTPSRADVVADLSDALKAYCAYLESKAAIPFGELTISHDPRHAAWHVAVRSGDGVLTSASKPGPSVALDRLVQELCSVRYAEFSSPVLVDYVPVAQAGSDLRPRRFTVDGVVVDTNKSIMPLLEILEKHPPTAILLAPAAREELSGLLSDMTRWIMDYRYDGSDGRADRLEAVTDRIRALLSPTNGEEPA